LYPYILASRYSYFKAADVFPMLQQFYNGCGVPLAGILGFVAWSVPAFPAVVRSRIQHVFRRQKRCDFRPCFISGVTDDNDFTGGFPSPKLCHPAKSYDRDLMTQGVR